MSKIVNCAECGKQVEVIYESHLNISSSHFCNAACEQSYIDKLKEIKVAGYNAPDTLKNNLERLSELLLKAEELAMEISKQCDHDLDFYGIEFDIQMCTMNVQTYIDDHFESE